MGRSRGGLTTKIHALVDAEGLPIALKLTEGQAHDGRSARDMLDALVEGQTLLADRAYDSDELRQSLQQPRRMGQHQAHAQPKERAGLQSLPVSLQKSRRALLQQDQTLPCRRHPIRQKTRQLPRRCQTRFNPNLDAV
jgi:transposase